MILWSWSGVLLAVLVVLARFIVADWRKLHRYPGAPPGRREPDYVLPEIVSGAGERKRSESAFGVVVLVLLLFALAGGAIVGGLYLVIRFVHWAWTTPI